MKKKSLNEKLVSISQKSLLKIWLFYHLAIIFFFLISLVIFKNQISIDSDLFNIIPKSFSLASIKKADEKMMSATSQNVFILAENENFQSAKKNAEQVYIKLKDSKNFDSISLYNDLSSMKEITDFLYKFRYNLIDEKTADFILGSSNDDFSGAQEFAMNALANAYSGFTMIPLDNIDSDPFLLTEYNLQNYLSALQNSGTAMSVKDGVLASNFQGKWYVMIRATLSNKGSKLASKNNAVTEIYWVCNDILNSSLDGTSFVFSGTPFHSHKSSNSATKEISIIATISMFVVIFLLIFIFRNPKPLFYSVASILISITIAFLATLATFHKMHVITLIFGTSLIGSCIDYSLHFFTHWAGNTQLNSGIEIRNHIFSGLVMAIISTGICFAILLFAPFTILKQISLFCLTGLVSSFLTTVSIYPYIKLPKAENRGNIRFVQIFSKIICKMENKYVGRTVIFLMFAFSIISIIVCKKNVKIKNNLLSLYSMEGKLLEDEKIAAQVTQYTPGGWYIISGNSENDVLMNEEKLRKEFETVTNNSIGYISTSNFIPSINVQKKSQAAYQKLLTLLEFQLESLGFNESEISKYIILLESDFENSKNNFVSFEFDNVPNFITSTISSAWLGEIENTYYTVLLPTEVQDYTTYRSLVEDNDNAFFISKSQDISEDLNKLTIMVLKFFLIAYILMFILLKLFYTWKQSFKIISVPILIIFMVTAIFAIFHINLEFFSVTGLILVFGLDLDYIIYMMENEKKSKLQTNNSTQQLEPFATMISFLTTIISFGALALSSFKPVHLIGLSIFIGLCTAYFSSFFYGRNTSENSNSSSIKKNKSKASLFSIVFLLTLSTSFISCATNSSVTNNKENEIQVCKNFNPVYVTNHKKVYLLHPSYLEEIVDSLQLLEGTFSNVNFSMLIYSQIDSSSINLSLFNEFGTDMGNVSFNTKKIIFSSSYFPVTLPAEYIIADIQNAYYKPEILAKNYNNSKLTFTIQRSEIKNLENNSENKKSSTNTNFSKNFTNEEIYEIRKIFDGDSLIEEIKITKDEITIINYLRGYTYRLINAEKE